MDEFERACGKTENPQLFTNVEFNDAQQMAVDHPETFFVPAQAVLDAIAVGDTVKVCDGQERFWTRVTAVDAETGVITAEVNNKLIGDQPYNLGDLVTYSKQHVYEVKFAKDVKLMGEIIPLVMQLTGESIVACYEMIEEFQERGLPLELIKIMMMDAVQNNQLEQDKENSVDVSNE